MCILKWVCLQGLDSDRSCLSFLRVLRKSSICLLGSCSGFCKDWGIWCSKSSLVYCSPVYCCWFEFISKSKLSLFISFFLLTNRRRVFSTVKTVVACELPDCVSIFSLAKGSTSEDASFLFIANHTEPGWKGDVQLTHPDAVKVLFF